MEGRIPGSFQRNRNCGFNGKMVAGTVRARGDSWIRYDCVVVVGYDSLWPCIRCCHWASNGFVIWLECDYWRDIPRLSWIRGRLTKTPYDWYTCRNESMERCRLLVNGLRDNTAIQTPGHATGGGSTLHQSPWDWSLVWVWSHWRGVRVLTPSNLKFSGRHWPTFAVLL
jgi:hypothetical protein